MSIKSIQQQPVYDAEAKQFVAYGSSASADFYSLVNPAFLTRLPPSAHEVRSIVLRHRNGRPSKFYGNPRNTKVDRCVYAFDFRLKVSAEVGSHLAYGELAYLSLGGMEPMGCETQLIDLEGISPEEFMNGAEQNNVFDVMHHNPETIQICSWGFLKLPYGSFEKLELDFLKSFQMYLCSKDAEHCLLADETTLIADQSWVITQPYEISPFLEKEYRRVLRAGTEQ